MTNSHNGQKYNKKIQVDKYWNFPFKKINPQENLFGGLYVSAQKNTN